MYIHVYIYIYVYAYNVCGSYQMARKVENAIAVYDSMCTSKEVARYALHEFFFVEGEFVCFVAHWHLKNDILYSLHAYVP